MNMRSNDIFLGFPYDTFNFTMWQEYVACKLNVEIGTYTHIANSLHFYEKDREKIMENYNDFMNFYLENRKKQNKPEISRTRMGINSLVEWIENECGTGVVETDIFTYPTKNTKELLKIDNKVLNKSKEKFWQVLMEFKPDTIVLYGALTVDTFKTLLKEKNQEAEFFDKNQECIEDLEKLYPFARMNVDSKNIEILACRHLMYYGKERKEF